MNNSVSKIVIVGGGSAGWLTAGLLASQLTGDSNAPVEITLVESPDVKTIGVGEGTWPTMRTTLKKTVETVKTELKTRVESFRNDNKLIEAQRIEERTNYDLEMMHELGYCTGIENYSRHLTGRESGEPPPTLLDYFPEDYLVFMDESHISVPQVRAMYRGDRSRKGTLVEYGFRLPSAMDNRPLMFDEFFKQVPDVVLHRVGRDTFLGGNLLVGAARRQRGQNF